MADETAVQADAQTVDATGQADNGEQNSGAGAQAVIAFKSEAEFQAKVDSMLKDRLERAERKSAENAKKAAVDAEAKALREQGEYKTLYEKELARAQAAEQREKALEIAGYRRDVADRKKLPAGLAEWLKGETLEELEANAEAMLANMPKPAAPNINASDASAQGGKLPNGLNGESLREQAIRLGVNPDAYIKQFIRS